MGDHPFRVTLENGLHSPAELLQGPQSRRRISLGTAPPDEEGKLRDGEEEVDEYQELVRYKDINKLSLAISEDLMSTCGNARHEQPRGAAKARACQLGNLHCALGT